MGAYLTYALASVARQSLRPAQEAAAQGMRQPYMARTPTGPVAILFRLPAAGWSVVSWFFWALIGAVGLMLVLSRVFFSCTGRTAPLMGGVEAWFARQWIIVSSRRESNAPNLVLYVLWTIFLVILQLGMILVEFLLGLAVLLLAWAVVWIPLTLLAYLFLTLEANPAAFMQSAHSTQSTSRKVWNVGGAFLNTWLDYENAVGIPLYNVQTNVMLRFFEIIYTYFIHPLVSADGDFSNNLKYDESAGQQSVQSIVTRGVGRRDLADAALNLANGDQVFALIGAVVHILLYMYQGFATVLLTLFELMLSMFAPVVRVVGDAFALMFKALGCVTMDPICALLELFQLLADAGIWWINHTLVFYINGIGSLFGNAELIPPFDSLQVACSAADLEGVPCECRRGGRPNEGQAPGEEDTFDNMMTGIYSGLEGCEAEEWSCQESADGTFSQVRTRGGVSDVVSTGTTRERGCPHLRRALYAEGHLDNMEEFGYYGCYYLCVNATRIASCPGQDGAAHRLVMDTETPCASAGASAAASAAASASPEPGPQRRRLGPRDMDEYLREAFNLHGSAGQHTSIAMHAEKVQAEAARKHAQARAKEGLGTAAMASSEAAMTREGFAQRVFTEYQDGQVLSRPGGLACRLARAMPSGAEDNAATRYFDTMCMVQEAAAKQARRADGRTSSYVSSAARAWSKSRKDAHRRSLSAERASRIQNAGRALVELSHLVSVRWARAHHVRNDRRLSETTKLERIKEVFARPSRRLSDGTDPFAYTAVADNAFRGLELAMRNLKTAMEYEFPSEETQRRRQLQLGRTAGIFEPVRQCPTTEYECPDHSCASKKSLCQRPPAGVEVGWVESAEWTMLDLAVTVDSLSDVPALLDAGRKCWTTLRKNAKLDPYSLNNIMLDDDQKKNVLWCLPYFAPIEYRVQQDRFDLLEWTRTNCQTVDETTGAELNACECNAYYVDKSLTFSVDGEWMNGIGIYMYARLHNGWVSGQYFLDRAFRGTAVDSTWQSLAGPVASKEVARLFGDQGHPGSFAQRGTCALVNLGSLFFTLDVAFLTVLVFLAAVFPAARVIKLIMLFVEGALSMCLSGEFTQSLMRQETLASARKAEADAEKRVQAAEKDGNTERIKAAQRKLDEARARVRQLSGDVDVEKME